MEEDHRPFALHLVPEPSLSREGLLRLLPYQLGGEEEVLISHKQQARLLAAFAVSYSICVKERSLPPGELPRRCPTKPTKTSLSSTFRRHTSSGSALTAPKSSIRTQWKPKSLPIASATASRHNWRSFAVELKNTVVKYAIQSPGSSVRCSN
jgi:hypothetical protein